MAAFMFAIVIFRAAFSYHVADSSEIGLLVMRTATALFIAAFLWMLYIALEPLVRRKWPKTLVSWSRLLAGDLRDPLVGRDVLFGLAGAGIFNLTDITWLAGYRMGKIPDSPLTQISSRVLLGGRYELAAMAQSLMVSIFFCSAILFMLFLLRLLLRRDWAVIVAATLFPLIMSALENFHAVAIAGMVVVWLLIVLMIMRFGLLTVIVATFVNDLTQLPLTPDVSAWYFNVGAVVLLVVAALTAYAFHASLGGKSPFGKLHIEE